MKRRNFFATIAAALVGVKAKPAPVIDIAPLVRPGWALELNTAIPTARIANLQITNAMIADARVTAGMVNAGTIGVLKPITFREAYQQRQEWLKTQGQIGR